MRHSKTDVTNWLIQAIANGQVRPLPKPSKPLPPPKEILTAVNELNES